MSTDMGGRTRRVRDLIEDMGDVATIGVRIKNKPKADVLPDAFNARINRIHRERAEGMKAAVNNTLPGAIGQSGRGAVGGAMPPSGWTGGNTIENRIASVVKDRNTSDIMEASTGEMGRAMGTVGEVEHHRSQLYGLQDRIRQLAQARKTATGGDAARIDVAVSTLKRQHDEHAALCGSQMYDVKYPKGPYLYEHVSPDSDGAPAIHASSKDVRDLIEYDAQQPRTVPSRTDTAASKSGAPAESKMTKGGKFASVRAKMAAKAA